MYRRKARCKNILDRNFILQKVIEKIEANPSEFSMYLSPYTIADYIVQVQEERGLVKRNVVGIIEGYYLADSNWLYAGDVIGVPFNESDVTAIHPIFHMLGWNTNLWNFGQPVVREELAKCAIKRLEYFMETGE